MFGGTSAKEKPAKEAFIAYLAERSFISEDLIREAEYITSSIESEESILINR